MTVFRVVPDLTVANVTRSSAFYAELVGVETVMDLAWVAIVADRTNPQAQLILQTRDATAPVNAELSIEVDDVDASYAAAVRSAAEIVHPLTDEPWGVRRFFLRDPDGHVVNVVGHR